MRELRVTATVLLATNGAYLNDPGGRERERVIQLNGCEAYLTDASRLTPEASFVGDGYVLVTDDVPGTSLRVKLKKTNEPLTIDQKLRIIRDVLGALAHCHVHEVIHRAISPATVILGPDGQTRLTDFDFARPGAPRKQTVAQELLTQLDEAYLAPEVFVDPIKSSAASDVFAAGVTIYELLTGDKPWKSATEAFSAKCLFPQPVSKVVPGYPEGFDAWVEVNRPPPNTVARDPRVIGGFEDISQKLVEVMLKSIAPRRIDRFPSAAEMLKALRAVTTLRQLNPEKEKALSTESLKQLADAGVPAPNSNPFVNYLLTLYSQSQRSNAGTRGLDAMGRRIYVETELDRTLRPAVLKGDFRLVVISGNAGDGKTAFIQQVETDAKRSGAILTPLASGNGASFTLNGRAFLSNYDGSQDEGEKVNDEVLVQFFAPFEGNDLTKWSKDQTRLLAINEGRLVDFLEQNGKKYPRLAELLARGFKTGQPEDGVAVVNLNLRSVVAGGKKLASIMDRLLRRLVDAKFWTPCARCDLRNRCYAYHNALTFQDGAAGAQAIERLTTLYQLTTLRSKLHITLRDLRSALAFMLVGTRNCAQIH